MRSNRSDDNGRLPSAADDLPVEWVDAIEAARPRLLPLGNRVVFFHTVGSTNDIALTLAAQGADGAVVIADRQTAGRGRRGHIWFSPPASGLYISVVLAAGSSVDRERAVSLLTLAAGVALADAVEEATGLPLTIKWPNDLFVGHRKVGGILAEAVAADPEVAAIGAGADARRGIRSVVLGYGINVGRMAYPPELGDRATSLELELGRPVDRIALGVRTLAAVSRRHQDLLAGRFDAILDAWRARAPASRGTPVTWQTPSAARSGITAGIDDTGALLVDVDGRVERIAAGELTWPSP